MSTYPRVLTEHERSVLGPELEKLAQLGSAYQQQQDLVRRMLSLIEPEMGNPESGLSFDVGSMEIHRTLTAEPS